MTTTSTPPSVAAVYPNPRYSWYVLGVIIFGYVFAFVDRTIIGLLAPAIQKDFGINDTQMGLLQGLAFALFYTLFGLPLGWMVDRFNRKWLLSAGMAGWSIMTAMCGMVTGIGPLFATRIGVGIGEATLNPCASSLIADYFPPAKRPRAFAFYTMSTAFAGILTYLIGGTVIAALRGYETVWFPLIGDIKPWQATFIIVGLPGLIPALMFAFTVKEPTRLGKATSQAKASWAETRAFLWLNRKSLGLMLVSGALVILEIYGAAYWIPSLLIRVHGWTAAEAAFKFGVVSGCIGIFSAYTSASITNFFKKRGMAEGVWMTAMAGCIGCTVIGSLGPIMPTIEWALPLLLAKALVVNYTPAATITAINEITPNEHRGVVTALYVVMTGLVAQGLGPFLVGASTDVVFADPKAIGSSISLVVVVTGVVAAILLLLCRSAYREALGRVTWEPAAKPAIAG